MARLDSDALAHARLLIDPTNAKVSYPVYGGGQGGQLLRFTQSFTTSSANGQLGFVMLPACGGGQYFTTTTATSGVGSTFTGAASAGQIFLKANASDYRCVAACIEVTYTGGEALRQGIIGFAHGQGTFGILPGGTGAALPNIDLMLGLCEHQQRVPNSSLKIVWRPSVGDELYENPNVDRYVAGGVAGVNYDNKAAIMIVLSGLKASDASNTFTFKMTNVIEYIPLGTLNIPISPLNRHTSVLNMAHILRYLDVNVRGWHLPHTNSTPITGVGEMSRIASGVGPQRGARSGGGAGGSGRFSGGQLYVGRGLGTAIVTAAPMYGFNALMRSIGHDLSGPPFGNPLRYSLPIGAVVSGLSMARDTARAHKRDNTEL